MVAVRGILGALLAEILHFHFRGATIRHVEIRLALGDELRGAFGRAEPHRLRFHALEDHAALPCATPIQGDLLVGIMDDSLAGSPRRRTRDRAFIAIELTLDRDATHRGEASATFTEFWRGCTLGRITLAIESWR